MTTVLASPLPTESPPASLICQPGTCPRVGPGALSPLRQLMAARPSPRLWAMVSLIGANVIWGGSAVASKAVLVHLPPLTLATMRVAIALGVLLPLVYRTGQRPATGKAPALLGLTGVTFFCAFQNLGLRSANATSTTLLNGAVPVLTALLAVLFLKERLDRQRLAGLLASLIGIAVVVLIGSGVSHGTAALGNLLPLASAASFAVYAVLGRRVFGSGNPLAVVADSTRYGLLFLLPGAFIDSATTGYGSLTVRDGWLLLYLGAGCSALAVVLCGYGFAHLQAGQAAVFGNLKPLVGVGLAVAMLGESLRAGQISGGVLVLLGVALAGRAPHRPYPMAQSAANPFRVHFRRRSRGRRQPLLPALARSSGIVDG